MSVIEAAIAPPITSIMPAQFDLQGLSVEQIIIHRIFARAADKTIQDPKTANHLLALPQEGREAIQQRITGALGSKSHGVEMSIERIDIGSFFQLGADLIHATEAEFIDGSKQLAKLLTTAQGTTTAPPGMLAVVRGRVGKSPKRFLAVIKADVHDGFGAQESAGDVAVNYLATLLLTPSQKLYKLGLLLELVAAPRQKVGSYDAGGYRAFLFDHLITARETGAAAAYYYGAFLGMGIQKSSKKLTQDFYEHTKAFIESSSVDAVVKQELREALRVEMRSSNAVLSAGEFATEHLPVDLQKPYKVYLEARGFPKNAVVKDVEYVKSRLRVPRKMVFTSGVKVIVPADGGSEMVEIVERGSEGAVLRIKGAFTEQD